MAKKPKKVSQQKIKRKLHDECLALATRIAKVRDGNTCAMCGCAVSGANAHGSHIIPRSADGYLAIHPVNILQMCMHCHLYVWHKNPVESAAWLEKKDPARIEWLREQRIINKTAGPITAGWYEQWLGVLLKVEEYTRMERDGLIALDRRCISEKHHDWIYYKCQN